jgi:hypothetical protein
LALTEFLSQGVAIASSELATMARAAANSPTQAVAVAGAALGYGLTVTGAFMRTMLPLRWLAVGSNLALVVFGALFPSLITFATALTLLPINLVRAVEVTRLTRRVTRAEVAADMAGLWLRPYMKVRRLPAGATLFSRGDEADRLYLLVEGHLELAELGMALLPGLIFGEIALFSPDHVRTHTARCMSDCTVLELHERTVKSLYYENPSFGFHLMGLLAGRLRADIARQAQR